MSQPRSARPLPAGRRRSPSRGGRSAPWLALLVVAPLAAACGGESSTSCESSRECSSDGLVCDTSLGRCVECVTGADCLEEGQICRASACEVVTPCVSSRECPGLVCDVDRGYCVECVGDVDCPGDDTCDEDGFCRTPPPPCVSDRMCSELGLVCDVEAEICVECVRDADCVAGFVCADRACRPGSVMDASTPDGGGVDGGPIDGGGVDGGPIDGGGVDGGPTDGGGVDAGPGPIDAGPNDAGTDAGVDAGPPDAGVDSGPACMPGSLLILFDASGSMANAPDGTEGVPIASSRWGRARSALATWLAGLPDELEVGLDLFPSTPMSNSCSVGPGAPTVPVGPLSTNRALIAAALTGTPIGSTPLLAALDRGYDIALTMSSAAPRAVLLVGDGDDNCSGSASTVLPRVATLRATGIETYVLGLTHESNLYSTIALDGGTRVSPSCLGLCDAGPCDTGADCGGTTTCVSLGFPGLPGTCGCSVTELCPSPLTCAPSGLPIGPANTCSGDPNCCSHEAAVATYEADIAASLNTIGADFGASCP